MPQARPSPAMVYSASIFVGVRRSIEVRLSEWGLGCVMLLWGILLLVSGGLFDTQAYATFGQLASQDSWGVICVAVGGGRLTVLFINGSISRSPHLRAALSFLSGFLFLQFALFFWQTGAVTGLVYGIHTIMDVFAMIRATKEARIADDHRAGH